jgi:hypothetical protein
MSTSWRMTLILIRRRPKTEDGCNWECKRRTGIPIPTPRNPYPVSRMEVALLPHLSRAPLELDGVKGLHSHSHSQHPSSIQHSYLLFAICHWPFISVGLSPKRRSIHTYNMPTYTNSIPDSRPRLTSYIVHPAWHPNANPKFQCNANRLARAA